MILECTLFEWYFVITFVLWVKLNNKMQKRQFIFYENDYFLSFLAQITKKPVVYMFYLCMSFSYLIKILLIGFHSDNRACIQMFYFFAKMLLNCPKYAQLMKISMIKSLCCNEQHQTYCKSLTFPVIQQENL